MNVLVACEFSGVVREAFAARGHNAWSCDLTPTEKLGNHYTGNMWDIIDNSWDLVIAHPDCQYLSRAGERWFKVQPDREEKSQAALEFFERCLNIDVPKLCVENVIGRAWRIRKPDQILQPYQFGNPITKAVCLWLKNLPKLEPTNVLTKYQTNWMKWGSHGDIKARKRTIPEIALAMAKQWG